jgi:hypothetical protein
LIVASINLIVTSLVISLLEVVWSKNREIVQTGMVQGLDLIMKQCSSKIQLDYQHEGKVLALEKSKALIRVNFESPSQKQLVFEAYNLNSPELRRVAH